MSSSNPPIAIRCAPGMRSILDWLTRAKARDACAWREHDDPQKEHVTVWTVFPASTKYFDPSPAPFMINYIVDDMDALLDRLKQEGVKIEPKRMLDESYGRTLPGSMTRMEIRSSSGSRCPQSLKGLGLHLLSRCSAAP